MIKFDNVSYIYNPNTIYQKIALDNINLEINENKIIGLIGRSGSGKSTFAKNLCGLLNPTYGKIYINDIDTQDKNNKNKKKIGYVFQYPEHQIFNMTVYDEIGFVIKNQLKNKKYKDKKNKINKKNEEREIILEALKIVGLSEEYLNKNPFELSGGEKRKVALASVFVLQPEILILDEPTVGLDFKTQTHILNYIKKIFDAKKITVIIISHDLNIISEITQESIVMDSGKIIFYGQTYKAFDFIDKKNIPDTKKLENILNKNKFMIPDNIIKFNKLAIFIAQKLKK